MTNFTNEARFDAQSLHDIELQARRLRARVMADGLRALFGWAVRRITALRPTVGHRAA